MTDFKRNHLTAKLQCETSRLAHIAAVNEVKWAAYYQWQARGKPVIFNFTSTEADKSIVCEAAVELMQKYPGISFVPIFK